MSLFLCLAYQCSCLRAGKGQASAGPSPVEALLPQENFNAGHLRRFFFFFFLNFTHGTKFKKYQRVRAVSLPALTCGRQAPHPRGNQYAVSHSSCRRWSVYITQASKQVHSSAFFSYRKDGTLYALTDVSFLHLTTPLGAPHKTAVTSFLVVFHGCVNAHHPPARF